MIDIYIESLEDLREIANSDKVMIYSEPIKVVAPNWMKSAVRRGNKIREVQPASNKCCTLVGLRRANQIENGETLSLQTIKRMKSFAARHSAQADWNSPDSKQAQALLLWGIPYSEAGSKRFVNWCDNQINKLEKD
jgi:hypothetical protein